jgi:hypothetical protein
MGVTTATAKTIFRRAADVLHMHLTDEEFVTLGEALDGDPENRLLDAVNALLEEKHPELFTESAPPLVCDDSEWT